MNKVYSGIPDWIVHAKKLVSALPDNEIAESVSIALTSLERLNQSGIAVAKVNPLSAKERQLLGARRPTATLRPTGPFQAMRAQEYSWRRFGPDPSQGRNHIGERGGPKS